MFIIALLAMAAQDPALPPVQPATVSSAATSPDGFTVGVDTVTTVKAKLGKPNWEEANSDGSVTLRYQAVKTKIKGSSFIPIVGMFAGGVKGSSQMKSFTFDANGKLKTFASSDFQTNCGTFSGCR